MYDDLNKANKKTLLLIIFLIFFAAALYAVIYFNLFSFSDFLEEGDIKPARTYGGIFCAFIGIVALLGLPRALTGTPMKSLEKYAQKADNPKAVLARLLETWENGYKLRAWCRMDEEYLITFVNGANANIVPIKDVVWAYKTTTRMYFVIKANTSLYVHYANRKIQAVPLGEKVIDYILQEFMKKHRDIAVGSNSDVEKLYHKKDMDGLKEYARQQRIGLH